MNEYIVFWTYDANYADAPRRVKANNPYDAIRNAFLYGGLTHYLVFQVGGDLVWDGTVSGACDMFVTNANAVRPDSHQQSA